MKEEIKDLKKKIADYENEKNKKQNQIEITYKIKENQEEK